MNLKHFIFALLCSLLALAFTGCSTTHVQKLHMTVSETPEVHGANTYQKPHSASLRVTGNINANARKNVNVTPEDSSKNGKEDEWIYKMGGLEFTGSAEFLYKNDEAILGLGIGYNDGLFHYIIFGDNESFYEYGFFFGFYHQFGHLNYEGKHCDAALFGEENCTPFSDRKNDYYLGVLGGGFAGLFLGNLFINYSVSVYAPVADIDGSATTISGIYSNYFTVGYRFKWAELSAGLILTYVDEGYANFGFTSGLSFYLL